MEWSGRQEGSTDELRDPEDAMTDARESKSLSTRIGCGLPRSSDRAARTVGPPFPTRSSCGALPIVSTTKQKGTRHRSGVVCHVLQIAQQEQWGHRFRREAVAGLCRLCRPRSRRVHTDAGPPSTRSTRSDTLARIRLRAADGRFAVGRGVGAPPGRCCTNRHGPARCQSTRSSPADAIRDWSAKGGHPIEDLTVEDDLTPLPGS